MRLVKHQDRNDCNIKFVKVENGVESTVGYTSCSGSEPRLRLTRESGTLSGTYSEDGITWTPIGSTIDFLPEMIDIGLTAAYTHYYYDSLKVNFDYLRVEEKTPRVILDGVDASVTGATNTFVATVNSVMSSPISYTWTATDQAPITHAHAGITDTLAVTWNTEGTKVVQVTASTITQTVTATHTLTIIEPPTHWTQSDWSGGSGQQAWLDETRYTGGYGIHSTTAGQLSLGTTAPHATDDDLNIDGYPDLLTANLVCYGASDGFSLQRCAALPASGTNVTGWGDINQDGYIDILKGDMDALSIYWGAADGYSDGNRSVIAGYFENASLADLDNDGDIDLLLGGDHQPAYIYWNTNNVFVSETRTELPSDTWAANVIVNLNGDDYLDVVIASHNEHASYIYWGSAAGYSTANMTTLSTPRPVSARAADLDRDGYLDLVFSSHQASDNPYPDASIYWGSAAGYNETDRTMLGVGHSHHLSIADVNQDGWDDLLIPNGNTTLHILWNQGGSFNFNDRTDLAQHHAEGVVVGDVNLDGYPDIVTMGWDATTMYVYWGGATGYSNTRRQTLDWGFDYQVALIGSPYFSARMGEGTYYHPSRAPDAAITNVMTMPPVYPPQGELRSSIFNAGQTTTWDTLTLNAAIPDDTDIQVDLKVRTGDTWTDWLPVVDTSTDGFNQVDLAAAGVPDGQYLEYRARLISSPDHTRTPILHNVSPYISPRAGVHVSPSLHSTAYAGTTVTYTHVLTNSGNGPDTFDLTHSEDLNWAVMTTTPVELDASATAILPVSVHIPTEVVSGTVNHVVITATSQADPAKYAAVTDTVTAYKTTTCSIPLNAIAVSGPITGFTGTPYQFAATISPADATTPITYTWSPQPVTGQGTSDATYQWATTGTYTVTAEAENCGGQVVGTHQITLAEPEQQCPAPVYSVSIAGPTSGYTGTTYTFSATALPSDATEPLTYTWSPEPASGQGTTTAAYTWDEIGTQEVSVDVTNCGGSVTDLHAVFIEAQPPLCPEPLSDISIHGPTSGATNTAYAFSAMINPPTATSPVTYTWVPTPTNGQGSSSVSYTWETEGEKTVMVQAENCGGIVTDTRTLSISAPTGTGDAFEADDTCAEARDIAGDGTLQNRTFHTEGDQDWVSFVATAGVTYTIEARVPPTATADIVLETYNSCSGGYQGGQAPAHTPDVQWQFIAPTDGTYYLRFTNQDPGTFGDEVAYQLSVNGALVNTSPGALVLVAGRYAPDDPLQPNIYNVTNAVYRLFLQHGYSKDRIYYLAPTLSIDADNNGQFDDVNATATQVNLQEAITVWAANKVSAERAFNLYMMDHGSYDQLYLDRPFNEWITAAQVDTWISTLEAAVPNVKVNIIVDACYAGSFIDPADEVSSNNRVVIASTAAYAVAHASSTGSVFSDAFIDALDRGMSLRNAFGEAQWATELAHPDQTPWLDDNGDATPNTQQDGLEAAQRGFAYAGTFAVQNWPPYVADAELREQEGSSGQIWAQVLDDEGVKWAWAVVYPPSYKAEQASDELLPEPVPIPLLDRGNHWYAIEHNSFDERGTYRILIYAEDNAEAQSRPRLLTVKTGQAVYLPLVMRK